MTNQAIINLITAVYMWFNQIADPSAVFNMKDLEQFYTPDFVMDMNDNITVQGGYESLFKHFQKFRSAEFRVEVQLPFQEIVISDDKKKAIVKYNIFKIFPENKIQKVKVIAIWHISKDGRLQRMNEVVHFEERMDQILRGPSAPLKIEKNKMHSIDSSHEEDSGPSLPLGLTMPIKLFS